MASSGGGAGNPMYLSQGGTPMPGLPIAGQGAPNDRPQNFGSFQEFLPEVSSAGTPGNQILPAGQGPNPSARGLTAEMFKYRSPQGVLTQDTSQIDSLRQQLAALQAQGGSGGGGAGGGNGQFGAARSGSTFGGGAYGAPNANPWSALSQMPGPGGDSGMQYFASTSLGGG